jgi:hypothetical protein
MPNPEDFNPSDNYISWPALLAMFAAQLFVLVTVLIAVSNHSNLATASSPELKERVLNR